MNCPICESINIKVSDTRRNGTKQYRRRKCLDCEYLFTTYEVDAAMLMELFEEHFDLETNAKIADIIEREFPSRDLRGGARKKVTACTI